MKKSTIRSRNANLIRNSRTIEVRRGSNGYGFTISGEKPSVLSNIVANSIAHQAGLRPGDFLLAINHQSVIKWSHDEIIQFINRCHNQLLKLQVSDDILQMDENDIEDDASDDDNMDNIRINVSSRNEKKSINDENDFSLKPKSEMIARKIRDYTHIEYKFFLKYVGSIELSNDFLLENKKNYFDIILKCIKKLKNEKRIPYSIIMTIVPSYLMLTNENQIILATFSSKQILCVNDERNSNYFGLITHNPIDLYRMQCSSDNHSMISCHVFYVDRDLLDHKIHCYFNEKLHLNCTFDIITGHCLQFPENSQYIQTIIRNLYGLPMASVSNQVIFTNSPKNRKSKLKLSRTTSSSNSDSGVGFRDQSSPVHQDKQFDSHSDNIKLKDNNQKVVFVEPYEIDEHRLNFGSLQNLLADDNKCDNFSAFSAPDIRQLAHDNDSIFDTYSQVSNWSCDFERFLNDDQCLKQFEEFLKKEYSIENIHFWIKVQNYRNLKTKNDRIKEAMEIYKNHLRDGAPELINIDHKTKKFTIEMINEANIDVFDEVQDQIFNLMKFDSYPRFLKLLKNQSENSENIENNDLVSSRKSNREQTESFPSLIQERRKSLLPWHRKSRYKSTSSTTNSNNSRPLSTILKDGNSNHSSMNSLDMAIVCNNRTDSASAAIDNLTRKNSALCRICIDNGFTTVIHLNHNESIYQFISQLLEKRGLNYSAFDVFKSKSNKPINQTENAMILSGFEINVERRILFRLFLPNGKVISVKSKITKILEDVLRPILKKYCYNFEEMIVFYKHDNSVIVNSKISVTHVDGQELVIDFDSSKKIHSDLSLNSSVIVKRFHSQESEEVGQKSLNTFEKFIRRQSFIYDRNKKEYKINNLDENILKRPLITKLKTGSLLQQTVLRKT